VVAKQARVGALPELGPVSLRLDFVLAPATRGDLSNFLKGVEDALTGIAYVDDRQVVELRARRASTGGGAFSEGSGVLIRVETR
jgi:Holliday junction resolvase RusA-like endonuclease